jgi:hypothetical protein
LTDMLVINVIGCPHKLHDNEDVTPGCSDVRLFCVFTCSRSYE